MRRTLLALVLIASPALGAEKPDPKAPPKGGDGTNVDLPYLMAPMKGADGKLAGYAYIVARLSAGTPAGALKVRDQLAFIQDAFVRDVNAAAVSLKDDINNVDIAAVESRLTEDARRIVGAASVKSVTVCTIQIANLHLKAAPLADATDLADPKALPKSRCEADKPA